MAPSAVRGGAAGSPAAPFPSSHALSFRHLTKSFGGSRALDDASLIVRTGTVHALLGGNGSGKSTTIKILAGVYDADAGELEVFGKTCSLPSWSPAAAQAAGVRFVHQDLGLFQDMSVEENFALDAGYPQLGPQIDWRTLRRRVRGLLAEYEIDADPDQPVNTLRPSDQTMVAIARALQDQGEGAELLLVLDEPTARLAARESALLLERVKRRAELGQTVIIVSHRLQEVIEVAQDFTVYRDGRVAGALVDAHPTEDELIALMAGGTVGALRPTGTESHTRTRPVLELHDLRVGPIEGIDLTVHEGEIVGLAGLVGTGRSSVLKAIFGAVAPRGGGMLLDGHFYGPTTIADAMAAGVAMVPEDRALEAAFADGTVSDNLAIAKFKEYFSGWMPRRRETRAAESLIRAFGVKVAGPHAQFSSMSGGNQQKAIIARWLQRDPKLLLLDEPTQGVDVMSRSDIYGAIRTAARSGQAVLVAASDLAELHALCDRILVLGRGRIRHEILPGQLDVDELTSLVLKEQSARD